MKTLHLKPYKWLLTKSQWVRINFLGYIQNEALAKHIKPFLKKTLKWKDVSARIIWFDVWVPTAAFSIIFLGKSSSWKWSNLDQIKIKIQKNIYCKNFLEFPIFQGFILERNLIAYDLKTQHQIVTFHVLNNNFFYSQIASSYVPDNTDANFLFLLQ